MLFILGKPVALIQLIVVHILQMSYMNVFFTSLDLASLPCQVCHTDDAMPCSMLVVRAHAAHTQLESIKSIQADGERDLQGCIFSHTMCIVALLHSTHTAVVDYRIF